MAAEPARLRIARDDTAEAEAPAEEEAEGVTKQTFSDAGRKRYEAVEKESLQLDNEIQEAKRVFPSPAADTNEEGMNYLWDQVHETVADDGLAQLESALAGVRKDVDASNAEIAHKLLTDSLALLGDVGGAVMAKPGVSPTRNDWLMRLTVYQATLLGAEMAESKPLLAMAKAQKELRDIEAEIKQKSAAAMKEYEQVEGRYKEEAARLKDGASVAGIYAYEELDRTYLETEQTLAAGTDKFVTQEDFMSLKYMLDNNKHLWTGEVRAARERAEEVEEMLDAVAQIRAEGKDADALVPHWDQRASSERDRMKVLAERAPDADTAFHFQQLATELEEAEQRAWEAKPREKGFAEMSLEIGIGVIEGLASLIEGGKEAGKQARDLVAICAHFASYGYYEPELVSDMAKAAEQGATTEDLLKGMVLEPLETPMRWIEAAEKGDWRAVGKETANLYIIAKAGKQGVGKVKQVLSWARARVVAGAGLKGGISPSAAYRVRKLAMRDKKVIEVRPVEDVVVKLREAGLVPKPEALKMKTIKEIDLHLGAEAADIGKVGYFRPKMPSYLESMSHADQLRIKKQYAKRLNEYDSLAGDVAELKAKGLIEIEGTTVIDAKSGKAFTGDYDLFDIYGVDPKAAYDPTYWQKMAGKNDPVAAQHGPLSQWENIPAGKAQTFADLVMEYRPSGESKMLIRFNPDGSISYTQFKD